MKAAAFEYHAPATIDETLVLLSQLGEGAKLIAGGLSLVPAMLARLARPTHLIDINRLPRAERPKVTANRLKVPPLMRHIDFEALPVEGPLSEVLAHLSQELSQLPVRLRGTFCGSLANADPASHWALAAVALGAEISASSARRGVRYIRADRFFTGAMTTALGDDEMITEVQIPLLANTTRFGFSAVRRQATSYPLAMALVLADTEGAALRNVRVTLGALEERPRRLPDVELILEGYAASSKRFEDAAHAAASGVSPLAVDHDDEAYRRCLSRAVVLRALRQALHE